MTNLATLPVVRDLPAIFREIDMMERMADALDQAWNLDPDAYEREGADQAAAQTADQILSLKAEAIGMIHHLTGVRWSEIEKRLS